MHHLWCSHIVSLHSVQHHCFSTVAINRCNSINATHTLHANHTRPTLQLSYDGGPTSPHDLVTWPGGWVVRWFIGYWDVEINDKIIEWLFGRCSWLVTCTRMGGQLICGELCFCWNLLKSASVGLHISQTWRSTNLQWAAVCFLYLAILNWVPLTDRTLAESREEISS